MTDLQVFETGPDDAERVTAVIHHAFAARRVIDPPSTALSETPATVGAADSAPASSRRTIGVRRWLARKRGRS